MAVPGEAWRFSGQILLLFIVKARSLGYHFLEIRQLNFQELGIMRRCRVYAKRQCNCDRRAPHQTRKPAEVRLAFRIKSASGGP
jgi:hypothetical protein